LGGFFEKDSGRKQFLGVDNHLYQSNIKRGETYAEVSERGGREKGTTL